MGAKSFLVLGLDQVRLVNAREVSIHRSSLIGWNVESITISIYEHRFAAPLFAAVRHSLSTRLHLGKHLLQLFGRLPLVGILSHHVAVWRMTVFLGYLSVVDDS